MQIPRLLAFCTTAVPPLTAGAAANAAGAAAETAMTAATATAATRETFFFLSLIKKPPKILGDEGEKYFPESPTVFILSARHKTCMNANFAPYRRTIFTGIDPHNPNAQTDVS